MASIKQINDKLYTITTVLADHFGFDADEAFELITDGDVNHAEEILKLLVEKKPASKKAKEVPVEEDDAVKKIRHNIDLWEKKLTAGEFKDREAHVKKIEAEKKKLLKAVGTANVEEVVEVKKTAKAKVAPAPAPKPKEEEKRIKRFSPAMTTQLGAALTKVKLSMTDKLKKEFMAYIEELDVTKFRDNSLADHMRNFAESKKPADAKSPEDESDEETPVSKTVFEEEELPQLEAESSDAEPTVELKVEELTKLKMLVATDKPEVLWDPAAKRHVKGPAMDADEDMTEVDFKKKKYAVGDKTGRVYEATDAGDVFAGFKGVGYFKSMTT